MLLSKPPNPQLFPGLQHKWLPTAPGVCSRCVCVFTAVCVHFGLVNADHEFWVWVTLLRCMSLSHVGCHEAHWVKCYNLKQSSLLQCECKWLRKFLPIRWLSWQYIPRGRRYAAPVLWWNTGSKDFRMSHALTLAVTVVSTEIQRLDK